MGREPDKERNCLTAPTPFNQFAPLLVIVVVYIDRPVFPESDSEDRVGEHDEASLVRLREPRHIAVPDDRP